MKLNYISFIELYNVGEFSFVYNTQTSLHYLLETCICVPNHWVRGPVNILCQRYFTWWILTNEMAGEKTNDFCTYCYSLFSRPM